MQDLLEYPYWDATISDLFWNKWMQVNLDALQYQWEQLENTRCIDNFRIAAGIKGGFREGWFFSDSDAYKWLDAAARYHKTHPHPELLVIMDDFIQLIKKVQMEDGYINTYNQIFFSGKKWINLWIEHELYCLGHLIEAIISVYQTFQDNSALQIATKAADLIVRDFLDKDGNYIPGHQEIEIALLKLYELTQNENYLKMAEQFLSRRGDVRGIFFKYLKQSMSVGKRSKYIKKLKSKYIDEHPEFREIELPEHVKSDNPPFIRLRWLFNLGSGKGHQQHELLKNQLVPEGHSVRYTYTQTAMVHLHRLRQNNPLLDASIASWDYMINKRSFPTGGLGAIPLVEGFGRDFELNGEYAYCETCAAIGSLLWNWQLSLATLHPKYADFFEWQLYNSVLVGIGQKGTTYLYRNPLISKGLIQREPWYQVPCCPSNISRTFAELSGKLVITDENTIYINQYIASSVDTQKGKIKMNSLLPWKGKVDITIEPTSQFNLKIRIPSWVNEPIVKINNNDVALPKRSTNSNKTASGYSPDNSYYLLLENSWASGDIVSIDFPLTVKILKYHKKVKKYQKKGTLTRGPLVYCLEDIDNPDFDVFNCVIDQKHPLNTIKGIENHEDIVCISGMTKNDQNFTAIPYYFWGNRGNSKMNAVLNFN
jgi:DUF1680 family protein